MDAGNIMLKNTFNLELLSDFVADTQIISELADRTAFVVRAGLLDKKDVPNLQKAYEEKRFKNLCYIFNGVERNPSYYGHYSSNKGHYMGTGMEIRNKKKIEA